ncbi:MAG: hypothetical protein ACM31L_20310 [Actinomycetota bacterium]
MGQFDVSTICTCSQEIDLAERDLDAGASPQQCFDRVAGALACSGVGQCRHRLQVSERASSLVIRMVRRVGASPTAPRP